MQILPARSPDGLIGYDEAGLARLVATSTLPAIGGRACAVPFMTDVFEWRLAVVLSVTRGGYYRDSRQGISLAASAYEKRRDPANQMVGRQRG
jgi:hypothetical protein